MMKTRTKTFRVRSKVDYGEKVYVVGSCNELGNWDPQQIVQLEPEEPQNLYKPDCEIVWQVTINIPLTEIQYRYCVASSFRTNSDNEENAAFFYAVKKWETNLQPRIIHANESLNGSDDEIQQFGCINDTYKVDMGWLDQEYLVQFKLFKSNIHNDPIVLWKRKHKDKKCYLKMIPVNLRNKRSNSSLGEVPTEESTEVELAEFRLKSKCQGALVEVSVLQENVMEYQTQNQFGVLCTNNDFISFQCKLADTQSIAYLVDFYVEMNEGDTPQYIGWSYILPSNLKENAGVISLPITSEKHLPIGELTVHYLMVHPLEEYKCNMEVSYARYWKESWKGLEVGHRGAGNSFHSQTKNCANIRENTIASLKYASDSGADMVEFDVQLSKDLIPVIYHDFHAYIGLKQKKETHENDVMLMPIKEFTLEQLQALKVYHKTEKGSSKFSDEEYEDHQPFPTLQKALDDVPVSCGFNVEIKWSMTLIDGTYELNHPFELNRFIDKILKVVLENESHRKIIFSSFHPDICTILRMKQNRFPVLFLTQGQKRGDIYDDPRTKDIKNAVLYAASANILGVNVNTEDLLRDYTQIQLAFDHKLIAFCWGDQNSDKNSIELLKKLGFHGIIFDKFDVHNTKTEKRSIFLCDDKETCKCIPTQKRAVSSSPEHCVTYGSSPKKRKISNNIRDGSPTSFQGILTQQATTVN